MSAAIIGIGSIVCMLFVFYDIFVYFKFEPGTYKRIICRLINSLVIASWSLIQFFYFPKFFSWIDVLIIVMWGIIFITYLVQLIRKVR